MISEILGEIDGGRVLDVGTQAGHFVGVLKDNLRSYAEIVGIDINESALRTAWSTLKDGDIHFSLMDAERLAFENGCFDLVNISASLHHVANIPRILTEMQRVLVPGGHFVIIEMHESARTQAELTSVYLHQWVAQVDSTLGYLHNKTLARQEFENHVARLELRNVAYYDYHELDSDPMEPTRLRQLESLIEKTIQRAAGSRQYDKLKQRGNELRQRLHQLGAQREPILIIVGKKP